MPQGEVRVDVSELALGVYRHMGRVFLVCSCCVRRMRIEVRRVFHVRLQLVVSLGCRML